MRLVFLSLCLTIPVGAPKETTITVYPVVEVHAPWLTRYGTALPGAILYQQSLDSRESTYWRDHEMLHHRQARELGWLPFALSYAATWGQPFEYYLNTDGYEYDPGPQSACNPVWW